MLKIKRFLNFETCSFCNKEYLAHSLLKVNQNEYICTQCCEIRGYTERNSNEKGKKTNISYSFEFETSKRSSKLYELIKYKFIGCYDSTIGGAEWKSPIFNNRKSFHCVCRKINKFSKFVGNNCGTHLHVSTKYKNILRQYESEIFEPLLNEMKEDRNKTVKFWGRYFGQYCLSVIRDTRYNSFNTRSRVETLEFRLLKFISAEQYIRACDFCIDITQYLNSYINKCESFGGTQASNAGRYILKKYREVTKNV